MIKPDKDWPRGELPDPPPMRVGYSCDTVGRDGVRRKADGTLRTWFPEHVFPLVGFGATLLLLFLGLAFGGK